MDAKFMRLCREFVAVKRHFRGRNPRIVSSEFVLLGSGLYSQVFEHPNYPGLVLKISGPAGWADLPISEAPTADVWPVYAERCMAHPSKHTPRILHFERISQRMCWAVMPKYLPSWQGGREQDAFCRHVRQVLWRDARPVPGADDWLWPLLELAGSSRHHIDLHAGNWMIHPRTGDVIITDPFSASGRSTSATEGETTC